MGSYSDDPSMHDIPREDIVFEPAHDEDGKVNPKLLELMKTPSVLENEHNRRETDALGIANDFSYCPLGCKNADDHAANHLRKENVAQMRKERGRLLVDYTTGMQAIQIDVNRILSGNHEGEDWVRLALYSIKLSLDDAIESFVAAYNLKDSIIEELRKEGS